MKKIKCCISTIFAFCLILSLTTPAFATNTSNKILDYEFSQEVTALEEKYGVIISVNDTNKSNSIMSREQVVEELSDLENHLKEGKIAKDENNRLAEENWQKIVESGRINNDTLISKDAISSRSTQTVYYSQKIGSYYPKGTTIRCHITANKVYSNIQKRYLWGKVIDKKSELYSGKGYSWKETDCKVQLMDGDRTYYVQVWGDLTEKYTKLFKEYTVTSKDWRIWYEAHCPA